MAKQKIDEGVIGKPVMFKAVGRDPKRTSLEFARRENSGGLILDMGIHDFDLARWLMGSEVERVYSEGGCLVYPELETVGDID
ncbi:MAG: Gfo/Idh/MocA family oxidoreductase, partial [Anaerolineales bacterium]